MPRHGRGISQSPEVSPSQKGVSLSISPNGREPEDARYRYPESPVDQTKWLVFRKTHVKNFLLPRVKVWSTWTFWVYIYIYVGVSKNNGTPKPSILIGFSTINHPFWGTPIFGNTHVYNYYALARSRFSVVQFFCFQPFVRPPRP